MKVPPEVAARMAKTEAAIAKMQQSNIEPPQISDDLAQRFRYFAALLAKSIAAAMEGGDNRDQVQGLALSQCLDTETGAFVPCFCLSIGKPKEKDGHTETRLSVIGQFFSEAQDGRFVPITAVSVSEVIATDGNTAEVVGIDKTLH